MGYSAGGAGGGGGTPGVSGGAPGGGTTVLHPSSSTGEQMNPLRGSEAPGEVKFSKVGRSLLPSGRRVSTELRSEPAVRKSASVLRSKSLVRREPQGDQGRDQRAGSNPLLLGSDPLIQLESREEQGVQEDSLELQNISRYRKGLCSRKFTKLFMDACLRSKQRIPFFILPLSAIAGPPQHC